jgi:hypothetical protein
MRHAGAGWLRHIAVVGSPTKGVPTARADGVTVYYPFALVELLGYREVDDDEDGEVLLSFLDEDGCQVTVRLRRELLGAIRARLAEPPDSSPR